MVKATITKDESGLPVAQVAKIKITADIEHHVAITTMLQDDKHYVSYAVDVLSNSRVLLQTPYDREESLDVSCNRLETITYGNIIIYVIRKLDSVEFQVGRESIMVMEINSDKSVLSFMPLSPLAGKSITLHAVMLGIGMYILME